MTRFSPAIVVILLAFVLAGCGGAQTSETEYVPTTTTNGPTTQSATAKYPGIWADSMRFPSDDDDYYLTIFMMPNGHKLVCVEYDKLECNWDKFNKESGNG